MLEDHKFTIRRYVDDEGEETDTIILIIDDVPFLKHPLVSSDFGKCISFVRTLFLDTFSYTLVFLIVLEEEKGRVITLGFKVNGKIIFDVMQNSYG